MGEVNNALIHLSLYCVQLTWEMCPLYHPHQLGKVVPEVCLDVLVKHENYGEESSQEIPTPLAKHQHHQCSTHGSLWNKNIAWERAAKIRNKIWHNVHGGCTHRQGHFSELYLYMLWFKSWYLIAIKVNFGHVHKLWFKELFDWFLLKFQRKIPDTFRVATKRGVGHEVGHGVGHGLSYSLPVVNFLKTVPKNSTLQT